MDFFRRFLIGLFSMITNLIITSNSETMQRADCNMYNSAPAQRFDQRRTTDVRVASMS